MDAWNVDERDGTNVMSFSMSGHSGTDPGGHGKRLPDFIFEGLLVVVRKYDVDSYPKPSERSDQPGGCFAESAHLHLRGELSGDEHDPERAM